MAEDLGRLRHEMVETQLIPRGITDPLVLDAFRKVPRHEFVKRSMWADAYQDHPLPIGESQTISQPYMVALMTQCLGLGGRETVLEVGTGSGYQAAILAELAAKVYSIERLPPIAQCAESTLARLGYTNITVKVADGTMGWDVHAPYDGIVVTAGSPHVPENLVRQLSNGGRLVIPVGNSFSQVLTVIEKIAGSLYTKEVCGCVFVPLIGQEGWAVGS